MSGAQHCDELLASMSDYVDGTLRQALCRELEKHLAECQNCRVVVNTLRKTVELYHQADPLTAPQVVKERLFMRLTLADHHFPAPVVARQGDLCPNCAQAVLEFDGMLNLHCPVCDWSEAGCFT